MTHLGYIAAAYAAAFVVVAGLVLWVRLDLARQKGRLAELEKAGLLRPRRRSG